MEMLCVSRSAEDENSGIDTRTGRSLNSMRGCRHLRNRMPRASREVSGVRHGSAWRAAEGHCQGYDVYAELHLYGKKSQIRHYQ